MAEAARFVGWNNRREGPLTLEQVRRMRLAPQTLVWREGFGCWRHASQVEEGGVSGDDVRRERGSSRACGPAGDGPLPQRAGGAGYALAGVICSSVILGLWLIATVGVIVVALAGGFP